MPEAVVYPPPSLLCSSFTMCTPLRSHLCNSISVLQRVLIDLFRRSTKWLAKSHPLFPSVLLLLQPTKACRWHTVLFIILTLIFNSSFSKYLISYHLPYLLTILTSLHCSTVQLKPQISNLLYKWLHSQNDNHSKT